MTQTKKATIWTRGFILITLCNVFANMAMFSVNTYLTTYMTYLGVGASLAGLIAGLYYAVGLAMRPIAGPMQATLNKKKLMTATYALGLIVNVCYGLFPSVGLFVLFRLIHGIQLAFYGSLSFNNLWGEGGGFRAIFLMSAFFSLLSVIPCLFLPNFDETREVRKETGVWYKNIIAPQALMPSFVVGMFMLSGMLLTTYIIPYGAYKGIENIGLYFTVNAFVMVITRPIAGKLTDKYGPGVTIWPGMALYMTAFLLVSFATDIRFIIAAALCASTGGGIVSPGAQSMTMQAVPSARRAVASNTLYTVMDIGNFLGPTLGGMILARSNYETMFRCALIPQSMALIVFALGWKAYLRNRDAAREADRAEAE